MEFLTFKVTGFKWFILMIIDFLEISIKVKKLQAEVQILIIYSINLYWSFWTILLDLEKNIFPEGERRKASNHTKLHSPPSSSIRGEKIGSIVYSKIQYFLQFFSPWERFLFNSNNWIHCQPSVLEIRPWKSPEMEFKEFEPRFKSA